jgi:NADH:quinone reductase (non-electrogenic)
MLPVPLPTGRNSKPRIVIIGAGFGGLAVARGLKHSGTKVTIVDRQNPHVFQPVCAEN